MSIENDEQWFAACSEMDVVKTELNLVEKHEVTLRRRLNTLVIEIEGYARRRAEAKNESKSEI